MALAHIDNFNCSAVNNTGLSVNYHLLYASIGDKDAICVLCASPCLFLRCSCYRRTQGKAEDEGAFGTLVSSYQLCNFVYAGIRAS